MMSWTIGISILIFALVFPTLYGWGIQSLRRRFTMRRKRLLNQGQGDLYTDYYEPLDAAEIGRMGRWLQESRMLKRLDKWLAAIAGLEEAFSESGGGLNGIPSFDGIGCIALPLLFLSPVIFLAVMLLLRLLFTPIVLIIFPIGFLVEIIQIKQ